jgi:hypothetical protein
VGIGFSSLIPVNDQDQLELFTDEFSRRKKVEEAVFRIRRKMGDVSLTKASLIGSERRDRRTDKGPGGGPDESPEDAPEEISGDEPPTSP